MPVKKYISHKVVYILRMFVCCDCILTHKIMDVKGFLEPI
jgi:hypothetical protein